MNQTITNYDTGVVFIDRSSYSADEVLTFTAAGEVKNGTILGRVTASGKLVPFDPAASDGSEVPRCVIHCDVTAEATATFPLDVAIDCLQGGVLRKDKLIINVDLLADPALDPSRNVTVTVRDQLRQFGYIIQDVRQLAEVQGG